MTVFLRFAAVLALSAFAACSKTAPATAVDAPIPPHQHHPPHSGTPVVLGAELYHLELVRDAATGKLTAYVLDGELENFVRVKAASFEIVTTLGSMRQPLTVHAIANPATGETVGDTSQFEAQADWLRTTATFDAILTSLEIRGTIFATVAFNFPKGNDKD